MPGEPFALSLYEKSDVPVESKFNPHPLQIRTQNFLPLNFACSKVVANLWQNFEIPRNILKYFDRDCFALFVILST
jgi:hypothetical protein